MERKCIICDSIHALVDVYNVSEIKDNGYYVKATTAPPTIYCNKCFMEKVWNIPKPA